MANETQITGRGLAFPIRANEKGQAVLIEGVELVNQSIRLILLEQRGERFFLREYGSRIEELMHEPNDEVLESLLNTYIREALATWEKRITVIDVRFEREVETMRCTIVYRINKNSNEGSFIFPFYRELQY